MVALCYRCGSAVLSLCYCCGSALFYAVALLCKAYTAKLCIAKLRFATGTRARESCVTNYNKAGKAELCLLYSLFLNLLRYILH